jgi:hypothetical protein
MMPWFGSNPRLISCHSRRSLDEGRVQLSWFTAAHDVPSDGVVFFAYSPRANMDTCGTLHGLPPTRTALSVRTVEITTRCRIFSGMRATIMSAYARRVTVYDFDANNGD